MNNSKNISYEDNMRALFGDKIIDSREKELGIVFASISSTGTVDSNNILNILDLINKLIEKAGDNEQNKRSVADVSNSLFLGIDDELSTKYFGRLGYFMLHELSMPEGRYSYGTQEKTLDIILNEINRVREKLNQKK